MNVEDLKLLISENESSSVISELQNGRNKSLPEAEVFAAQLDPGQHNVMNRVLRPDKRVKCDTGDNDATNVIQVSNGEIEETTSRIVPVERISLALQRLIVERSVSFSFGNPVDYNATPMEGTKEQDVFDSLMAVLRDVKSRSFDRKVARSLFSTTEVAEYWYLAERPNNRYGFDSEFKMRVAMFSPLRGDRLFPYFDETGDLVAFSREYSIEDRNKVKHKYFETFMEDYFYKWMMDSNTWVMCEGYPKENEIGKIPVIYAEQQHVEWAMVQSLIERLETLLSNFADTNDYHAAPKIFVTGDIHGWAQKGESGSVIEGDDGATAQYLSWQQAPEAVRLEIETILKMIYTITQTPDISFDNIKGVSAVSGVALKMLFMDAHLKVQAKSEVFDEYLQRRANVIQAYLAKMNAKDGQFVEACDTLMVEPELVPYMIEDETTKIANLATATGNKALVSRKTAIQRLGWSEDVDAEIEAIDEDEANGMTMTNLLSQEPYDVPMSQVRAPMTRTQ